MIVRVSGQMEFYLSVDGAPNDLIAKQAAYHRAFGEGGTPEAIGHYTEVIIPSTETVVVFVTDDGYILRRVGEALWGDGDMTFGMDRDGWPTDNNDQRLSGYFTCKEIQ